MNNHEDESLKVVIAILGISVVAICAFIAPHIAGGILNLIGGVITALLAYAFIRAVWEEYIYPYRRNITIFVAWVISVIITTIFELDILKGLVILTPVAFGAYQYYKKCNREYHKKYGK